MNLSPTTRAIKEPQKQSIHYALIRRGHPTSTAQIKSFHLRGRWMSLSPRKKTDACHEIIRRRHLDADGEGSMTSSCFSGMDLDCPNLSTPCCNCLPRSKTAREKPDPVVPNAKTDRAQHDDDASHAVNAKNIATCHSIGSGRFSPDTGVVILYGHPSATNPPTNDLIELVEVQEDFQKSLPKNPFLITIHGYSGTERNSISAEKLLDRLQSGHEDGITENVLGKLLEVHDSDVYYGNINQIKFLETGGAFYSFTCRTCMTPYERKMVKTMANMTDFEDETKENFVPAFNIDDSNDINKYTYVLQKAAYILPGVQVSDITPEVVSSKEYQECCQPVNGTKIWDNKEENTFRFTRPIIPHIYSMTIQFRVSRLNKGDLGALSSLLGVCVDHAILMERTKRSVPPKIDGTAKAKSILCYTAIPGGVLVTHATVILNTAIPAVIAKVIDTFGRSGLAETCETAERTRQYFLSCRQE
eukprot:CCRYP_005011-RA/>CCRYP_005011-RA protein AED:0.23 eAED:0.23 QI:0/-1/0/1/-1/1/1/0/472